MQVTIDTLEAYLDHLYSGRVSEQGLFMRLVEEIGEVAEVLSKRTGRKAPEDSDLQAELGAELADVIHYAVAIAAVNHLNLNDRIVRKDTQASIKYHHGTNLVSFLSGRKDSETD